MMVTHALRTLQSHSCAGLQSHSNIRSLLVSLRRPAFDKKHIIERRAWIKNHSTLSTVPNHTCREHTTAGNPVVHNNEIYQAHPTSIIAPTARIGSGCKVKCSWNYLAILTFLVQIGPYCIVGADVTLEEGVELKSHVQVIFALPKGCCFKSEGCMEGSKQLNVLQVQGRTLLGANCVVYSFAGVYQTFCVPAITNK
jgi:hypothetical protein